MATQENGHWHFNPGDTHVLQPGSVLVLMTSPGGRAAVEGLLGA